MTKISIMRVYKRFKVSALPTDRFVLTEDFEFGGIIVRKGFLSNGANVPRIFHSFIPPNLPRSLPAVFVHDYLCDVAKNHFNKTYDIETSLLLFRYADKMFKERLEELELTDFLKFCYHNSVSAYTYAIRKLSLMYHKKYKKQLDIYAKNEKLVTKHAFNGTECPLKELLKDNP